MKTGKMHLIAGFTMFVLCISICTTTANATASWEDDFEDPNLPGWTFYGYWSSTSDVKEGNFSAADHTLKVLDDYLNFARHDSTVNVGTWSFDMFVPDIDDTEAAIYVYIMSNGSRAIPTYPSYFVGVGVRELSGSSHFIVWTLNGLSWKIHSHIYKSPMQGWHHIDINRTSDGHFYIYFNGTLEDDFSSNEVTSSTYLEFYCYHATGAAIDNLVVEDTSTSLPWELIAIVGSAAAVVIVIAIVLLRRR